MLDKLNEIESCFYKEHRVILITGGMASGKSTLVNKFLENKKSFVFNSVDFEGNFIIDFGNYLFEKFSQNYPETNFSESHYNLNRFNEILNHNKENKEELFNKIVGHNLILNNYDYFINEKIDISEYKEAFINKADQKIVWEQGRIVVESLLVDLINFIYPEFNFDEVSQINKPKQVVFVFDEIDHILNFIDDNFISFLIEYLEKKLSSFENYDFTKDKDLKLSDLIDIRLIITSRNKHFEKYQSKIELYSVIDLSGDNSLLDLPVIKQYKKETNCSEQEQYQFANELFFKYSNEVERQFLLVSILFKKFNINSFNLYPELKLTEHIITNYISNFYFISKENEIFQIDDDVYYYFDEILKNINPDMYKELIGRSELNEFIMSFYQKVPLEDFDIFRKLAYFNYFDVNNALASIFPDIIKKFIVILDKYKHLLNKNNYHFSIKKEYIEQIDKYNKVVDSNKYSTTKKRIKELWISSKSALIDKKSELDKNIKSTKLSINNYKNDLSKFNSEFENINSVIFEEENKLAEQQKKLSPYQHKRPVIQTLSITFLSLFLIISSLFDDFILNFINSEIFLTILNWIFRIAGILGLFFTSKSLYRIYIRNRDKEKRKELEEIINSINKRISEQLEIKSIISADIKATEAKIQELEIDISNYKEKIEEIDLKLNEPFI